MSAVMFPNEKSKSSGVTKPERAAEAFLHLNKMFENFHRIKRNNLFTTFYSVWESQDNLRKNSKKNFKNLTTENTKKLQ